MLQIAPRSKHAGATMCTDFHMRFSFHQPLATHGVAGPHATESRRGRFPWPGEGMRCPVCPSCNRGTQRAAGDPRADGLCRADGPFLVAATGAANDGQTGPPLPERLARASLYCSCSRELWAAAGQTNDAHVGATAPPRGQAHDPVYHRTTQSVPPAHAGELLIEGTPASGLRFSVPTATLSAARSTLARWTRTPRFFPRSATSALVKRRLAAC
jgi:hypothetical protein